MRLIPINHGGMNTHRRNPIKDFHWGEEDHTRSYSVVHENPALLWRDRAIRILAMVGYGRARWSPAIAHNE